MDILSLLDELIQLLEGASSVPFSKKVMIEKDVVEEIVNEIKLKIPDELKQARWVKEERQRILQDAQKEANDLIKEAENKIIGMIDEHEITKKAIEKRDEMLDAAQKDSNDLRTSAEKYKRDLISATREHADSILEDLENLLKENLDMVRNNRKEL